MTRVEEATRRIHNRALLEAEKYSNSHGGSITEEVAYGRGFKAGFIEGYEQAEKDLELTWEDIQKIDVLIYAVLDEEKYKRYYTQDRDGDFYEEVLKRFNKEKKEK